MARRIFVTGIGTDVGKTLVSAILAKAWNLDYWKPIQAGNLDALESDKVKQLLLGTTSIIHPTTYLLSQATAPHYAAEKDGININIEDIKIPVTELPLLIEGAGGLMAPINQHETMLDFIRYHQCEVIVVSRNYIGSINHTILTIEMLRNEKIPLHGIVFNDIDSYQAIPFITQYTSVPVIGQVPFLGNIDCETIERVSASFSRPDWL